MAQLSIFVSHSHQDNEWCRQLVAALKAVGYDVWYDETGLRGGAAWVATIQREVQARDVFLPVVTPEAWVSKWVQDELQLAIATRRRIVPVLLRDSPVDGFLLTTQWVKVIGEAPQTAARPIILAIETPPALGLGATQQIPTETLNDLVTLFQSLVTEERYSDALPVCDRALALDPDNIIALRVKGSILDEVGQEAQAAVTFGHLLSVLNPATANKTAAYWMGALPRPYPLDSVSTKVGCALFTYVAANSDNAQDIVQAYRTWRSLGDARNEDLALAIRCLAPLGAVDTIVELASQYDIDGSATRSALQMLAHGVQPGQLAALLQLGARLGKETAVVVALANAGQIDAVMQQAPQVQRAGDRRDILDALHTCGRHSEFLRKGAYMAINRLCTDWFGYPPPRADSQDAYQASLLIWSEAMEQLGQRKEAAVVKKAAERRGWLW